MKLISSIPMPAWAAGFKVDTYRCGACHTILPLRRVSNRKTGIRLRESWYCSARCFTAAAEQEVSRILKAGTDHAGHVPRMPLGLSLISRGLLTVDQLKKATDAQRETGVEMGEMLVRNGVVTEKQVTAIRAADWGCPVFTVPKYPAPIKIRIPLTLSRLYSIIPVHHVAATNLLLVAFLHSVEYELLYAVERMMECQTKPCFVTPRDFQIQMQHLEHMAVPSEATAKELHLENTHSAAEIAGVLCSHGLEMEADEACMEMGKDYLWARLSSELAKMDLLFRAR